MADFKLYHDFRTVIQDLRIEGWKDPAQARCWRTAPGSQKTCSNKLSGNQCLHVSSAQISVRFCYLANNLENLGTLPYAIKFGVSKMTH